MDQSVTSRGRSIDSLNFELLVVVHLSINSQLLGQLMLGDMFKIGGYDAKELDIVVLGQRGRSRRLISIHFNFQRAKTTTSNRLALCVCP